MIKAAIIGGSGYTGSELARILSRHPEIGLVAMLNRKSPKIPKAIRTDAEYTIALFAIIRFVLASKPLVTASKMATLPMGLIMAKSVANIVIINAASIRPLKPPHVLIRYRC